MSARGTGRLPAVILAAGVGSRLGALTADRPKALLEVAGLTLLDRQLTALEAVGCEDVFVVSGHCADRLRSALEDRGGRIRTHEIFNPAYATANNVRSFLAARHVVGNGFCLLNSDIIFDPAILAALWAMPAGSWIVVDTEEPLGAEEMKVQVDGEGRVIRINKQLDAAASVGEYIGLASFDPIGARRLVAAADRLVAAGGSHLYYEDAMDREAAALRVRILPTQGRAWTEIDDGVDLERARHVGLLLRATASV